MRPKLDLCFDFKVRIYNSVVTSDSDSKLQTVISDTKYSLLSLCVIQDRNVLCVCVCVTV